MNLTLKDLVVDCQRCGTTGEYKPQGVEGGLLVTKFDEKCPDCDGKGIKLTEIGAVFEEFIQVLKKKGFF